MNKRGKVTPSNPFPNSFMQQNERKSSRTRSHRGRSPSGKTSRWPCKDYFSGTCNNSFVKNNTLQNACSTRQRVNVDLEKSAHSHIVRLMNSGQKDLKRMMAKVLWLCWKREIGNKENSPPTNVVIDRGNLGREVIRNWNKIHLKVNLLMHGNWVTYFRTWRRRSLFSWRAPTCRSQSNVWNSQRLLHVTPKIETKILRSNIFGPGEPHERSPNAPKFEDRSQEETKWQEQGAREAAWKLAKNVLKLKKHQRAAFFSPSEHRCLPASTLKPEEREFVVDSDASMHMISKKDLNDAEMDTLTKSCSPTIVVQTQEKAIVYGKELDTFLTMKVIDNTPAVLSLGKTLRWKMVFLRMDQWSKTTFHERRDSDHLQYIELCSYCGSRFVKFILWIFINFTDIHETRESILLTFFTYSKRNSGSEKKRCT